MNRNQSTGALLRKILLEVPREDRSSLISQLQSNYRTKGNLAILREVKAYMTQSEEDPPSV